MIKYCLFIFATLTLLGCGEAPGGAAKSRILLMGDSLMAANRVSGAAVSNALEADLGEEVIDRSVPGARVIYALPLTGSAGLRISSQFVSGDWDWIVLNGYGNDIIFGCGCGACDTSMARLISADGQRGAIPDQIRSLRASGARLIYTGYLRTPGFASPVDACGPIGDELDRRIALLAAQDAGVTFLAMSDIVPGGDQSFHGPDRVHPSAKGSRAIADRIAAVIAANER